MSKKFATNIDLLLNELQNAKIHIVATDPTSPQTGQIYYNSTINALKFYNGSGWVILGYLNQMSATGAISANNNYITNVTDPVNPQDAATKNYVDNAIQGLKGKSAVLCATTTSITLSGTQTIDGIAVNIGDRVLVKDQSTASQNGIYIVSSGTWTRATDVNTWNNLVGAFVFVEEGTTNADTGWLCAIDPGGTINSTAISWIQFSTAGQITASNLTGTGGTTASVFAQKVGNILQFRQLVTPTGQGAVTLNQETNDIQIIASNKIESLNDNASNGILVQVDGNTVTSKTITNGSGITVTNGNGVSGNPTIAVDSTNLHDTLGFTKKFKTTFTFVTSGADIAITHNLALPSGTYNDLDIKVYETSSLTEVMVSPGATANTANIAYITLSGTVGLSTNAGYYTIVIIA